MYEFTNKWFQSTCKPNWDKLIPILVPKRILEIGSFEGQSTCYLIEKLGNFMDIEICCIDTWEGGLEHDTNLMPDVKRRFHNNLDFAIENAFHVPKIFMMEGTSEEGLIKLYSDGEIGTYNFIYVDGSHKTTDVLSDAVLAFKLLAPGGVMGFDDYKWNATADGHLLNSYCPKLAIDAFVNTHYEELEILAFSNEQLYIKKK